MPQAKSDAPIEHLRSVAPWHVKLEFEREADGEPFVGALSGPGYETMRSAMRDAYGVDPVVQGQGGSIPLCNVFADTYPGAEIILLGVEEPLALIHAPNESVDPGEIEHLALSLALFLHGYGSGAR